MNAKLDRWETQIAQAVEQDNSGPTVAEWDWFAQQLRQNIANLPLQPRLWRGVKSK